MWSHTVYVCRGKKSLCSALRPQQPKKKPKKEWGFFPSKQAVDSAAVDTLTPFWHYLPEGSIRSHRLWDSVLKITPQVWVLMYALSYFIWVSNPAVTSQDSHNLLLGFATAAHKTWNAYTHQQIINNSTDTERSRGKVYVKGQGPSGTSTCSEI